MAMLNNQMVIQSFAWLAARAKKTSTNQYQPRQATNVTVVVSSREKSYREAVRLENLILASQIITIRMAM